MATVGATVLYLCTLNPVASAVQKLQKYRNVVIKVEFFTKTQGHTKSSFSYEFFLKIEAKFEHPVSCQIRGPDRLV